MGKWENGKTGKWENGKMGKWENGKMGKWENGKTGKCGIHRPTHNKIQRPAINHISYKMASTTKVTPIERKQQRKREIIDLCNEPEAPTKKRQKQESIVIDLCDDSEGEDSLSDASFPSISDISRKLFDDYTNTKIKEETMSTKEVVSQLLSLCQSGQL
jgi:hypothetical protein